jgi:hypothetical protein
MTEQVDHPIKRIALIDQFACKAGAGHIIQADGFPLPRLLSKLSHRIARAERKTLAIHG